MVFTKTVTAPTEMNAEPLFPYWKLMGDQSEAECAGRKDMAAALKLCPMLLPDNASGPLNQWGLHTEKRDSVIH